MQILRVFFVKYCFTKSRDECCIPSAIVSHQIKARNIFQRVNICDAYSDIGSGNYKENIVFIDNTSFAIYHLFYLNSEIPLSRIFNTIISLYLLCTYFLH